jgi:hypothetical protein
MAWKSIISMPRSGTPARKPSTYPSPVTAEAQDDLLRPVDDQCAVLVVHAPGAHDAAIAQDQVHDGSDGVLFDAGIGAQLFREHLGQHVPGEVIVVHGPRP